MNFWFKWSTDTIPLGDRSSQMSNLVVSSLRSVYPLANFVILSQQHNMYCSVFGLVIVHQWKRSNGISINSRDQTPQWTLFSPIPSSSFSGESSTEWKIHHHQTVIQVWLRIIWQFRKNSSSSTTRSSIGVSKWSIHLGWRKVPTHLASRRIHQPRMTILSFIHWMEQPSLSLPSTVSNGLTKIGLSTPPNLRLKSCLNIQVTSISELFNQINDHNIELTALSIDRL